MSQAGRYIITSGPGASVLTLTSNIGGPVPPTAGNINVVGGNNITGTGNPGASTITFDLTGTTNHAVQVGNAAGSLTSLPLGTLGFVLTSNGAGVDPSFQAIPSGVASVTGGSNINITGTATNPIVNLNNSVSVTGSLSAGTAVSAGTTVVAGTTITAGTGISSTTGNIVATAGQVNAGTTMTAGTGITATTGNITATAGNVVITAGNLTLPNTNVGGTEGEILFGGTLTYNNFGTGGSNNFWGGNSGNVNVANTGGANNGFGAGVLQFITSGSQNTGMGHVALQVVTTGSNNSAYGGGAGNSINTGGNNTYIGYQSAQNVQSGNSNIALGYQAGQSWGAAVSNNIAIGNVGSVADSGRIRIGTNAVQTSCFITGIDGVNVGSVAKVVTMASDQLGTATITAGSGVTVTPGANTITIAQTTTPIINNYTTVNSSPYVVTATDYYMSVDTSTIPITIQLPNAPTQYRTFIIKDSAGNAFAQNVTVTTVGGAVLIEGATTYTMNTNYASINLLYDGVGYQLY